MSSHGVGYSADGVLHYWGGLAVVQCSAWLLLMAVVYRDSVLCFVYQYTIFAGTLCKERNAC